MKRFIRQKGYTLLSVLCAALAIVAFDFGISLLLGGSGVLVAAKGMLAKVFDDPELKSRWEQEALREGENKTEFTELEIGTTFAKDGPKPSRQVPAAPILFYDGLERVGEGRVVNIKMKKPLYQDVENIIKKWRYSSQKRRGSEQEAERGAVKAAVDNIFLALKETEIQQGLQETANANAGALMRHLVELLSDNTVKRQDVGVFWSLCAGFDHHHYVNVGLRESVADGGKPVGKAEAGVWLPPTEHPNMYIWQPNNVMSEVTFSTTQATHSGNIETELAKVTSAAKPSLDWLRMVYRIAWRNNVIPASMRVNGKQSDFYILYVPGRVRDLLEQDTDFMNLFQSAYQGKVQDNPLLHSDDLMYKDLVIRDSKWLEETYFSMEKSFNATGSSDTTDMTFNLTTLNGVEWADIDPGTRSVVTGSAMEGDSITPSEVGRCFLLGANGVIRATGNDYALERMEVTDYGNEDGVGQSKYFGQSRIDSFTNQGSYDNTPQSMCFVVYQGS